MSELEHICGCCYWFRPEPVKKHLGCCLKAYDQGSATYRATTFNRTPECNPFCRGWRRGKERRC